MGIKTEETLLYTIGAYIFFSLTSTLISGALPKLIGLWILALLIYQNIKRPQRGGLFCIAVTFGILIIHAVFYGLTGQDFNDYSKLLVTMLALTAAADEYFVKRIADTVRKHRMYLLGILHVCNLMLVVSILSPQCYGNGFGWGDSNNYFVGYAVNGHTLSSCCCLLIVFYMLLYKEQKLKTREYLVYLPSVYCILFAGARTFLISVVFLIVLFIFSKVRDRRYRLLILIFTGVVFVVALASSSMMSKFQFAMNNQYASDLLDALTNGRTKFWSCDLNDYLFNSNVLQLLTGKGLSYIYGLNKEQIGLAIWAHNDMINNLLCTGVIGLVVYLYVWIRLQVSQKYTFAHKKIKWLDKAMFAGYIWIPMILNGMFSYQHYVLSILLLAVYCKIPEKTSQKEEQQGESYVIGE